MVHTIFFYEYTITFQNKLFKLNRYNKCQIIYVIEPIKMFKQGTTYVAIEYLNYQIDPFFKETMCYIKMQCLKNNYLLHELYTTSFFCNVYVDIILPFMPANKILKKMKVFMTAAHIQKHGLYEITFFRNFDGNVESLFHNLRKDIEKHLPKIPLLVKSFYNANWFC